MPRPISSTIPVLNTIKQVRKWRNDCQLRNESVGFVATMGALHAGHASLVSQSLKENDHTIVSIFVNPSQFAPHEDLDSYPRTLDSDLEKLSLSETKVDAVFVPKVSEMYPSGITTNTAHQRGAFVNVLGCSEQLEGVKRPQFFRGVATVVTKLFNIVKPDRVYFGQKDAQQCVVIKTLVRDLCIDTEVRVCPTVREANGLAMSSRNAYLSTSVKEKCSFIYKSLCAGLELYKSLSEAKAEIPVAQLTEYITAQMNSTDLDFDLEYLKFTHPESLDELQTVTPGVGALVSTAVLVPKDDSDEKARLIDNIILP